MKKDFGIGKNKYVEFSLEDSKESFRYNFYARNKSDHAGFSIYLTIFGKEINFSFYDTRHWNDGTNTWVIYNDDGTNDYIPYSDTEEWAKNESDFKSVEYWFKTREDNKKEIVEIDTEFGETFIVSNINIILNDNEDWPEHLIKGIDCETGHEIRIEENGMKRIKQYTGDKMLYC